MDQTALVSQFHSEEKCRAYLEQLRWPDGVRCPRCDASKGISRLETRGQFECDSCGYQFSVRVGTIFHASHLPLWKWCLAAYVMCEAENRVSTNQLKRALDVSYKTAWYLSRRIRGAMTEDAPDVVAHGRNPYLYHDTLLRLLGAESMPYRELIAGSYRAPRTLALRR
jgi:transposase-like protein